MISALHFHDDYFVCLSLALFVSRHHNLWFVVWHLSLFSWILTIQLSCSAQPMFIVRIASDFDLINISIERKAKEKKNIPSICQWYEIKDFRAANKKKRNETWHKIVSN